MNIIIKDMEMPKNCEDCHLESFCSLWVEARKISGWTPEKKSEVIRHPDCSLTPVVLCKDCMYAPSGTDDGEDRGFGLEWPHDRWPEDNPCPYKCEDGWYSHKPKQEFYCAYGKKEET